MWKRLIYLILFVALLGLGEVQAQDWDRAAYWDGSYPSGWAGGGEATRDALAAAGYTILDAGELKTWMDARIADKKLSVVVFCRDVVPDTVCETMSATCTLRKYLDAGGKIVWYSDIPMYYVGYADGTTTTWADAGAPAILGFDTSSAPRDSGNTVTITGAGASWGLTQTWTSQRPAAAGITTNLTVLATDAAGNAPAWVKHYVMGDKGRGFVRFRDTGGQPLIDDIIRVAEYLGLKASNPDPPDGAMGVVSPLLSWEIGTGAKWHDIYLGTDPTPPFKTRQPLAWAMWYEAAGWIPGTTYYWRIDEVEADGTTIHTGDVWSFTAAPLEAYNPDPRDGAKWVDLDPTLTWSPGAVAIRHDVYFGTDETEVANGTGGTFKGNQDPNLYAPGTLLEDTTYYWRIDGTDIAGTTKYPGDVWSFRTMPDIPITDPDLLGRWTLDEGEGDIALDWSGHGNHGVLRNEPQWVLDGYHGGALQFDGQNDYVSVLLDVSETEYAATLWFKTTNGNCGLMAIVDSDIGPSHDRHIFLTGGNIRIRLWDTEEIWTTGLNLANGLWHHVAYTYGATIGGQQLYVDGVLRASGVKNASDFDWQERVNIGFSHDAAQDYFQGVLDDVRIYDKILTQPEIKQVMRGDPLLAWNPKPANASIPDIEHATPLSWSPGDNAAKHDVYLGTDRDAVEDADTTTTGVYRGRIDPNSYTPGEGVEFGQTYYWRIDEFNTDATISEGRIWSFTVADYLIVDDFESYDDYCNRIFYTYGDGWGHNGDPACGVPPSGGNGTGSTVGYLSEPYAEQTIVHGGKQAMPMEYLNDGSTGKALYSEAERTFEPPQDWTRRHIKALTLWFRGLPGTANSSSYDAVTDTHTLIARTGDIWGASDQFRYVYKRLSGAGSIQAKVLGITVGATEWSKAGVMIREDLEPNSPHAFSMLAPLGRTALQQRALRGGNSFSCHSNNDKITFPYWVKIERVGNTFTASYSANGTTWVPQPNDENLDPDTTASNPANITMSADTYIGLALTSNNVNATVQAQFSNVTTTGTVTGQWQAEDVGVTANDAEQLYVAVQDSSGTVKVVEHPDPNAVQLDTWQEWNIDLADFAPVNLTSVKKIYIGVGDRNLPKFGGGGMLYIDDIRLYARRCVPLMLRPDADIAEPYDCKVDYKDLRVLADEWLFEIQLQDWEQRVVYWDSRFRTSWINEAESVTLRDGLTTAGYTLVNADELKTWMDARIADGKFSVVVFARDNTPDTVAESMDTNCTVRKYLDAGGKIVFIADIPFWDIAHADGTWDNWAGPGAPAVLGIGEVAVWNSANTVTITGAGRAWGLTQTWQSLRSTPPSGLTVLATDSAGNAAAWVKHFVPGDKGRGFVRLWDRNNPGIPPVDDIIRAAESKGYLAADLYEDDAINFKDYALLADMFLDEVLWP